MNQVRSTGTVSFYLRKKGEHGSTLQRRIYVRHEKAGWKVKDLTGTTELKMLGGRAREKYQKQQGNGGNGGNSGSGSGRN